MKIPPQGTYSVLRQWVMRIVCLIGCSNVFLPSAAGQPLPSLEWASYHGGPGEDGLRDMAIDKAANLFVIGSTVSSSGIATAGSYQSVHGGLSDAYMAKYNSDGMLMWSTYYGGNNNDFGQSITVDDMGYIYVTGFTSSGLGFASAGAFQPINNGGFADAFVAKFDSDGNRIWSTYFGGSMDERSNSITVDKDGNVTIIGWTDSASSIASPGAFQSSLLGQDDIYLAQFDNDGNQRWATYYGDIGFDIGLQVDTDGANNLVIAGWTTSMNNFATAGAFQPVYSGGTADAFLAKFDQNGFRIWCTYFGGSIDEYGDALIVADNDDIYLAGPCNSPDGIATAGTHQPVIGGNFDAFVARFNPSGMQMWGTYYGGNNDDFAYGLAIDSDDYLYLTGYTRSTNGIATPTAHQIALGGDWDSFLAKFSDAGLQSWGTYLGGNSADQSLGVEVDSSGYVYITGLTVSPSQISTPGSEQEIYGGGPADGFIAMFSPCTDPILTFLNGGYLCSSSNFVFDLEFNGNPPFTFTYSLDGVLQPPVTANTSPFFHLVTEPWSDSLNLVSVHSGPCYGQITGLFDYVHIVPPVSVSTPVITCNQTDLTYTVSLDLSGGVFTYLSVGPTNGFINGNQFESIPQPFGQDYDIIITAGLMCDSVFLSGASGCIVDCPDDFGMISADALVCEGSDISLQASGGVSYAWEGPDNFLSSQQNPVITGASINNEGTYTVIITDNNTCKDTLTMQVDMHVVQGSILSDSPVCIGDDIDLIATGGVSYVWSGPDNFMSISGNPTIVNASLLNAGTYSVTITDIENCAGIWSSEVIVNPLPVAFASDNGPVCEGETILLTASGGNTYSWQGPDGFISNQQNPALINAVSNNTGTYTVTVTDANNCLDDASVDVTILSGPDLLISSNSPVCIGIDIELSGSGADSYQWTGPNGFNSALADPVIMGSDPADAGLYSLIGSNANGCSDTTTMIVDVLPLPVVMATADQTEYCEGDTIHLQVNQSTTYAWVGPSGFSSDLQTPAIENVTSAQQGIYTVEISDANGCTNEGQVNIVIVASPAITILGDLSICEGNTLLLTAEGDGSSYVWTDPSGVMVAGSVFTFPDATILQSGTYAVTSSNAQNCISMDSVNVNVAINPIAIISGPDSICAGEEVMLVASGGQLYIWSNGQTGAVLSDFPPMSSVYEVIAMQGECSDTTSWNILVNPLPVIDVSGAGTIAPGESIMLMASGADQYVWDPAEDLSCSTCQDPIAMPDSTTVYCVTGLLNGCAATECVVVNVVVDCDFDLPNIFSPDFNGANDFWCSPIQDCSSAQTLTIFDRWGNALFNMSGEEVCWDGTSGGNEVGPGVYVYLLELKLSATETRYRRGDILLVR